MNRIIHLKFSSESPRNLKDFYADVFGWSAENLPDPPGSWRMCSGDGPGINCSVHSSGGHHFDKGVSLVISVESLAETVRALAEAGGRTLQESIHAFGNIYQYCKDPDGNVICLVAFGR